MVRKTEERSDLAELHRLRGVFLRGLVPTRFKLRERSAKRSESQESKSRFR